MAGCCGGSSKRVTVEFEYLVVDGETCDRCGDSRTGVRAAVADALAMLPQLDIKLVERELAPDRLADSNRVLVNGLPAEEWLGGTSTISSCESCSDLLSTPACCREVEVGGVRTEAISRELVLDAILAAAGLAPAGVPGENCCGQASPSRPSSLSSEDSPLAGGLPAEAATDLTEHAACACGGPPAEASSDPATSAGCGCSSPSRKLSVTLVNGPGCGWGGELLCDPGSEVFIPVQEGATWDMPSAWRVQTIGETLKRSGLRAELDEYDIYALPPELRHRVLDAITIDGAEFPMVLVNGLVACHSGIDLSAVLRTAWEAVGDESCC